MYENYLKQPRMKKYVIVDSLKKLKSLATKLSTIDEWSFDTETNTTEVVGENSKFKCVGISMSWGLYDNYYIPLTHVREEDAHRQLDTKLVVKYLKPQFERTDIRLVGRNIKFDMHVFARIGIWIKTLDLWDGMVVDWLCNENLPKGLKENTMLKLGIEQEHFGDVLKTIPKEVKKEYGFKANQKATFDLALIDDAAPYALADSFYTWCLYLGELEEIEKEKMDKIYAKTYTKFLRTLFVMEERGIPVDLDRLNQMQEEIQVDIDNLMYEIYELAGCEFNIGSSEQLAEILFGYEKPVTPIWESDDPKKIAKWNEMTEKQRENAQNKYLAEQAERDNRPTRKNSFNFKVLGSTATGAPSTGADTLFKLSKQSFKNARKNEGVKMCKLVLEFKKLEKLKTAFLDGLKEQLYDDGKAHPSFNIVGTDSGRLSCSSPNLQQLPKAEEDDKYQIRSLFMGSKYIADKDGNWVTDDLTCDIPEGGSICRKKIIAGDYNNLEMRVMAHWSKDKNLLHMFETGADTHSSTAVNMFELKCDISEVKKKYPHLRQAAKVLNFLLSYGGGATTLYNKLKDDPYSPIDLGAKEYLKQYKVKDGIAVAQKYIDRFFETYDGIAAFMKSQKRKAHSCEYIQTLLKRKRRLPNINGSDKKDVAYCERLSVNSCIQGSAADITMSGQNRIDADPWFVENGVLMLLQVHDELVFECPENLVDEAIEKAKWYMEHPFGDKVELRLPMLTAFDSGDTYQEAK